MNYAIGFLAGLFCGLLVYAYGYRNGAKAAGEQLKRDLEALGRDE